MNHWLPTGCTTRRAAIGGLIAGGLSVLSGCGWDGNFTFLGYTTKPNFDENIKSVYVPIFKNKSFQTTPFRGMEYELTRAVIREVESRAPIKVISDPARADTELLGTIVSLNKNILNRNQFNEVREGEVAVGVELVWRDLRSGVILSNPRKPKGVLPSADLPPFDPDNPPLAEALERPIPITVVFSGRYLPELGESNASAQTRVCDRLAKQVVNMMEKDWQMPPRNCP